MTAQCPFCGADPFEYVDVGVGSVPVAVTCCELGDGYFRGAREPLEEVTIDIGTFNRIADMFFAMRRLGLNPDIFE